MKVYLLELIVLLFSPKQSKNSGGTLRKSNWYITSLKQLINGTYTFGTVYIALSVGH